MSANVLAHGAPETRLVHSDISFKKTAIANAVHELLDSKEMQEERSYMIQKGDTSDRIAQNLGVINSETLKLISWRSLEGQTITYIPHQKTAKISTGGQFPANDEKFALAA